MKKKWLALSVIEAAMLTACGGGDSAVPPVDTNGVLVAPGSPAGLYHGSTSTGRQLHAIVLETGAYWLLYSAIGNPSVIAGFAQGNASFSNGAAFSQDFRDFNVEGTGITDGMVSASYFPKENIAGNVVFSKSTQSFMAKYDFAYEASSSLQAVAGDYRGTAAVAGGIEPVALSVSPSGAITGLSQSGCRFAGTATTHSGWVYSMSIKFAGAPCANGTATVTGVAYYDPGRSQVYAAALNGARNNGFLVTAAK